MIEASPGDFSAAKPVWHFRLPLADGSTIRMDALDAGAAQSLGWLSRVMEFDPDPEQQQTLTLEAEAPELKISESGTAEVVRGDSPGFRLHLVTALDHLALRTSMKEAARAVLSGTVARCPLQTQAAAPDADSFVCQFMEMTSLVGLDALRRGGSLLHGALALYRSPGGEERGVILAASGGTGKSTASRRLPPPWLSLCDDTTLMVRGDGGYRAHPWPTWSRFLWGGPGGSWQTGISVPVDALVFLTQAGEDRLEPARAAEAVALCVGAIEQASRLSVRSLEEDQARRVRMRWLDLACLYARELPCFRLELTLDGRFWELLEDRLWPHSKHEMAAGEP